MGGTKNINKKLLIAIFTALFLIGFIYSIYSQATSAQNNAVSSLGSNSIIQEIISSASSGYSTAGQYLSNFLSINVLPSYVWTIIIFLMTTLLFVAIYLFLFEIFMQKANITQNETIRKSKILFVFALSIFSAIAIGYAIPFLLNLYGFILLILVLIALFFFGRAVISYGKSFHHSIKSFADDIEKNFLNAEKELKIARFNAEKEVNEAGKQFSEKNIEILEEGIKRGNNIYNDIKKALDTAEKKFVNILSNSSDLYKKFINNLIEKYKNYLNDHTNNNNNGFTFTAIQIAELNTLIRNLENKIPSHQDKQHMESIRKLYNDTLGYIKKLPFDDTIKKELEDILDNVYNDILSQYKQILSEIQATITEYYNVKSLLTKFYQFEDAFKSDINLRFKKFLGAPDNRKYDIGILSALNKSEKDIKEIEKLVDGRIQLLEKLLH